MSAPWGRAASRPSSRAARGGSAPSRLVEPGALEAVEQRGRVLPEALHRRLGEVDRVGGEEPQLRHVLEDHELHAVVDLLALLGIQRAPALLQHGVEVRHAPRVPVLALGGVQRAEERGAGAGAVRRPKPEAATRSTWARSTVHEMACRTRTSFSGPRVALMLRKS